MARKREILDLLGRDELLPLIDSAGLSVSDRRAKHGLLEALASSRRAKLEDLLPGLPRTRLKELCRIYTPTNVVRVLAETLAPYRGRVYDPCCGSGGMFVPFACSVAEHRKKPDAEYFPSLHLDAGRLVIEKLRDEPRSGGIYA